MLAKGKTEEKDANADHLRVVGHITEQKCYLAVLLGARIEGVKGLSHFYSHTQIHAHGHTDTQTGIAVMVNKAFSYCTRALLLLQQFCT